MVILNLKANNFMVFKDFEISFTYPKKIVKSIIENEYLAGHPNFRYKKFVLVMGGNASGKTALGKLLLGIFNFVSKREYSHIVNLVEEKSKEASFSLDFVANSDVMYRVSTVISPASNASYDSSHIKTEVRMCKIEVKDSYESCVEKLSSGEFSFSENYIKELEKVEPITWMFKFTGMDRESIDNRSVVNHDHFFKVLEKTLMIMDPRIEKIEKGNNFPDSFFVYYPNRTITIDLVQGISYTNTLSSGTNESISIAHLLSSIKCGGYGFFYCDEKFSHIHSDAEAAFLSLMVSCLGENNQLIVTTHNQEIAALSFPKHSFVFLRRERDDSRVSCIYASEILKRNTDSLKSAIDNDLFGASPSVDDIYLLKEL